MKNQTALLKTEWHQAPDIEIEPFTVKTYKNWEGKKRSHKYANFLYGCNALESGELVLTIYTAEKEPLFRAIVTKDDFKSQYYKDGKASNSTIIRYLSGVLNFHWYNDAKIETDEKSRETVAKWLTDNFLVPLKTNETPLKAVEDIQWDIRKRAVERRNDKIRKSIDDNMLEIKPLPKRFDDWVDKVVLKDSRYIIYKYSAKKKKEGWCTYCKTDVTVDDAKNGHHGRCPNCKSVVKFISTGRMSKSFTDEEECSYIQPDKNGDPIFRYINVKRHFYTYDFRTYSVATDTHEHFRWFYGAGKKYNWDNFRQTGEYRFCECYYASGYGRSGLVYPYNMQKVFKNAVDYNGKDYIKYIPFAKLLNNQTKGLDPHSFYVEVIKKPIVEYLAKFGLYRLCNDVISLTSESEYFKDEELTFKKAFPKGIGRGDIKFFIKNNVNAKELDAYYTLKNEVPLKRIEEAINLWREGKLSNKCLRFLKYTSPQKLLKYAESIKERYWRSDLETKTGDWSDYAEFAERLGWDMKDEFILFPRDFWEAHDRANDLIKIENVKKQNKAVAKYARILNKSYRMEGKEFFIRAAENAEEIVKEGQKMHHCVANYVSRVAEGRTGILFMRRVKEPDKPLYTIEVMDGEIIQCRGKNNRDMDKKNEKAFFKKWKATKFKESERKVD